MRRCPEYIIGVRITYFFELHNAIKSWTKYFNGQTIFLFCEGVPVSNSFKGVTSKARGKKYPLEVCWDGFI